MEKQELERLAEELKGESFILVVFNDVGSVRKSVAMANVIPEQFLALGSEFELIGKNGIVQQSNKPPPEPNIIVPKVNIGMP